MIDSDEPPSLFGYPMVVDPTDAAGAIRVGPVLMIGVDVAKPGGDYTGFATVRRDGKICPLPEAPQERAAFVRHHVAEILKKSKTSASHRTKGKLLLERAEEAGDTGAGDESRAEYEMAGYADALVEAHMMALIQRTAIDG